MADKVFWEEKHINQHREELIRPKRNFFFCLSFRCKMTKFAKMFWEVVMQLPDCCYGVLRGCYAVAR